MKYNYKPKNTVYTTTDYAMFKSLHGNRPVVPSKKLYDSLKTRGYIGGPIVVNEKYEVINGQHRLACCKELGIPIDYIIIEGLTIDDCIYLNTVAQTWTMMDYVYSFASRGYSDYILLENMVKKYSKSGKLNTRTIIAICQGNMSGLNSDSIKNGTLKTLDEKELLEIFEYLSLFDLSKVSGKRDSLYFAIFACYSMKEVDNSVLIKQFQKYGREIQSVADIKDAIEQIEAVYNKSRKHTFIVDVYRRMASDRSAALPGGGKSRLYTKKEST